MLVSAAKFMVIAAVIVLFRSYFSLFRLSSFGIVRAFK